MNPATPPDKTELAEEFPVRERWTYVNHAAVSPWPASVRRAVVEFATANHRDGPASFADWVANERELHQRYARLLGAASADEISVVPNTTEGVGIVAAGLDWRAGDNLVTAVGEFPTNQLAWAALADRGVTLRAVDLRFAADPEAALLEAMDERTRLLTVSSVQWTDGFRLDLGRLGPACRAAGVLFFVDAIQQLGALRVDVERDAVDCLAAGSHKWQMGPEGLGVFYCRAQWRDRIRPLKLGWRMLEQAFAFDRPERAVAGTGQRFEPGSPNTLGQMALNAALALQERYGTAWIEQRVLANTAALISGIDALPALELASRRTPERRSGIVSLRPLNTSPRTLARRLAERNIVAVARGELLRLSPHFYQGEADMQGVLEGLENFSN